jgi:hypothetical protein
MGLTVRYFWLDGEGRPHSLSRVAFERLWNAKATLPWRPPSGQPVRFVEAIIDFANRQPRRIRRLGGLLAYVDAAGFVDQTRQRDGMRLALESARDTVMPEAWGNVRSMVARRAGQRFRAKYQFELTRREAEAISSLIRARSGVR